MADDRSARQDGSDKSRVSSGLVGMLVLAAALVVFILQNTQDVKVDWLFFDGTLPLWLLLLVTAIAGALLAEVAGWLLRRRRDRREDRR